MRGIRRPAMAPGPSRDLFHALHELYDHAGRPSLNTIAEGIAADDETPYDDRVSHQTIGEMLHGRAMPKWRKWRSVVCYLAERTDPRRDIDAEAARFNSLWQAADSAHPLPAVRDEDRTDPAHPEPPTTTVSVGRSPASFIPPLSVPTGGVRSAASITAQIESLRDLLTVHEGLTPDQVERAGRVLFTYLQDSFMRHLDCDGLPDDTTTQVTAIGPTSCTYWDRPYRPLAPGTGPTALEVTAKLGGRINAHARIEPFPGIAQHRDTPDGLIVIDASHRDLEPLLLSPRSFVPGVSDVATYAIDEWVTAAVTTLFRDLAQRTHQILNQQGFTH